MTKFLLFARKVNSTSVDTTVEDTLGTLGSFKTILTVVQTRLDLGYRSLRRPNCKSASGCVRGRVSILGAASGDGSLSALRSAVSRSASSKGARKSQTQRQRILRHFLADLLRMSFDRSVTSVLNT